MKRIMALLLVAFAIAGAQQVPVAGLHLVPEVMWPAPTYRLLGKTCDQLVAKVALPKGATLESPQCYRMDLADPDQSATYLYFIARSLAERFTLERETMQGENALVQTWRGKEKTLLFFVRFDDKRFTIVVGWLQAQKPKSS